MKVNIVFKRLERIEIQLNEHEIKEAVILYVRRMRAGNIPNSRPDIAIYEMTDQSEQSETVADLVWKIDRGKLPDPEET